MLCSLPTTKPTSSSWLDRLHILKGFTIPNPSNSPLNNPSSAIPEVGSGCVAEIEQMGSFNLVGSILSDLFVMDAPDSDHSEILSTIGVKRGLRKQPNPRICVLGSRIRTRNRKLKKDDELKVSKKIKKTQTEKIKKFRKKRRVEKELNLDSDLNPKFGTEATVIDTSTPGWKSCKILFHKGSVWKVRDKKQFHAAKKKKRKNFGLMESNEEPSGSTSLQKSHTPNINEDTLEEPIDPIQTPIIRPKYTKPSVREAAKSIAHHLKIRTKGKKKISPLFKSSFLKGKSILE